MKKPFLIDIALLLLLCCAACAPAFEESELFLTEETDVNAVADGPADIAADAPPASIADEYAQSTKMWDAAGADYPAVEISEQESAPKTVGATQSEPVLPEPIQVADNTDMLDILAGEPVILTVSGDGVGGETTWTLKQLQALSEGYRESTYSTTNNWPSFGHMKAQGVSLSYLLRQAGLLDKAASFKFSATDGYYVTVTYEQIFGEHYAYAFHNAESSGGAVAVEPVIAWAWGDVGKVRPENIRPFFGQSGPLEVNTSAFVKDLCYIEVSAASVGAWASPVASIDDGGVVAAGTELKLLHDAMDSVRIYYTLDGSEPDYYSLVYNPSTSYFQPQLITPLILEQSVTLKTFAAAFGKDKSPVVTFSYTVK